MSIESRETFEEWAEVELPRLKLIKKGDTGEYLYKTADYAWKAWQASRQALECEAVDVERIADTVRDNLGDIFACTRVWEAWQVGTMTQDDFTPADETELADEIATAVAEIYTYPASAATLQFGNGNLVVVDGSFDDVPAVFISPAIDLGNAPGTALSGKDAERRTDMLYGDETVLLFKTAEHASVVAGALIRGKTASADKQTVSVPEWIKCSDRLPTEDDGQVVWTHDSYRKTVELTSWAWAQGLFKNSYITHWMPTGMIRPQPPKQEGE